MEVFEECERCEGYQERENKNEFRTPCSQQESCPEIGNSCHAHQKEGMSRTPVDVQRIADQQQVDVAPPVMPLRNGIIEQEEQRVDQYEIE